jgi:hypothetical protein
MVTGPETVEKDWVAFQTSRTDVPDMACPSVPDHIPVMFIGDGRVGEHPHEKLIPRSSARRDARIHPRPIT